MSAKLKRTLSLPGAIGLTIGFVVGGSIYVLIPTLAGITGPSLFLAYALSAIPAIFAAFYFIQLGGALPVTGANYIAVTRWVSPVAGFSISLATAVGIICANCMVAWGFAQYLAIYFPEISVIGCAVAIILFFGLINWIGIKSFERIQLLMLAIFILAMLLFGFGGLFHIQPEFLTPFFPKGIDGFITVVAIATFSWGGVIAIVEVAGEVKNPKRNIPLSIIISMIIIGILYVLQTIALTGTVLWSEAAKIGPTAVLVGAGTFLPEWAVGFIAFGALMAMATTINAMILMGAREILVWSVDLVIPAVFQRINPRFNTPELTILLVTTLSVLGVLFAADIDKYALMGIFALMVVQSFGATAVLRMPKQAPAIFAKALFKFSPFWRWFVWIGCVLSFFAVFVFGFLSDPETGIVFFAIWLVGIVYWHLRKSYLKKRGIILEDNLKKISAATLLELEESDAEKEPDNTSGLKLL